MNMFHKYQRQRVCICAWEHIFMNSYLLLTWKCHLSVCVCVSVHTEQNSMWQKHESIVIRL